MKTKAKYTTSAGNIRVETSQILCGSVLTNIPITVGTIEVEEMKAGFNNTSFDGTDFKDLSFE